MNGFGKFLQNIFINKNLSKFLVLINISIFLTVFAATAAIISIFIEIEISQNEILIQTEKDLLDDIKEIAADIPLYRTIIDTVYENDLSLNRQYKILEDIERFQILIDYREFYLNRSISLHRYSDNFFLDWQSDMETFVNDLNYFYEQYRDVVNEEYANSMLAAISDFYEEFNRLQKEYANYDIEMGEIKFPTVEEVFSEDLRLDYYYNFHSLAIDRHRNLEDFIYITEDASADVINVLEGNLSDIQYEIDRLSKYEVRIIFVAFVIQIIVFLIIQFFEIGAISRERER
tara:strand:- start:1083 stop:1949 length:867 start_codon:yes stop_codon:yes gene_type:complete